MSGGDKFVLRNGRTFRVRGDSETIEELPANEAIEQCEKIRKYMRERWGYDDSIALSDEVIARLEAGYARPPSKGNGSHA